MMYRTNMSEGRPWGTLASEEHAMAARKIAEEDCSFEKQQ